MGKTITEIKANLTTIYNESVELQNLFSKDAYWHILSELYFFAKNLAGADWSILTNRVGLKMYDEYGKLFNFDLRTLDNIANDAKLLRTKYYFVTTSSKTDTLLAETFLNNDTDAKSHLIYFKQAKKDVPVYLSEGVYDTLALLNCGVNAVCALSNTLSDAQIQTAMNFKKVVLAFDNDGAGVNGMITTAKSLNDAEIDVAFAIPSKVNDVKDWNDNLLKNGVKNIFNYTYDLENLNTNKYVNALELFVYKALSAKHYCDFNVFYALFLLTRHLLGFQLDKELESSVFYKALSTQKYLNLSQIYDEFLNLHLTKADFATIRNFAKQFENDFVSGIDDKYFDYATYEDKMRRKLKQQIFKQLKYLKAYKKNLNFQAAKIKDAVANLTNIDADIDVSVESAENVKKL